MNEKLSWFAMAATLAVASLWHPTALAKDAVLVELFTSQGCSSCPPADQLLSELGNEHGDVEIIPLSFHVDYWNHIGWKDAFSSPEWSKRQREYAALSANRTYTPQLVVQGSQDCVGSNESCVRAAVEEASTTSAGSVEIRRVSESDGSLIVEAVARLDAGKPEAIASVALFESDLKTQVRRGENRGRELRNDFVVRELRRIGTIRPGDTDPHRVAARFQVKDGWDVENLGVVVFVQERKSRAVLAVARATPRSGEAALQPLPKEERVPAGQVALGGHCPVALVEGAKLIPGSPGLQYRYRGAVYQLMSRAAAAKFASQPGRYVPPFSVFDPVVYSETREKTTGALDVFVLHQGKPWFFLNTDNRNKFLRQPSSYVQTALSRASR